MMKRFLLTLIFLLSRAICSIIDRPADRLDRLMVYHRFQEAKDLLHENSDDLSSFCTSNVVTRCIDLMNYRVTSAARDNLLLRLPIRQSFIAALDSGTVVFDAETVAQEAQDIFEIILPAALSKKTVMTRAFNSAVFHSDYNLMERFMRMDPAVFESDEEGLTPLMAAIKFHRRGPFQWLLQQGANIHYINCRGENLLHILARVTLTDKFINSMVATLILEDGLDWKLENNLGWTPLSVAEAKENYEVVEMIQMIREQMGEQVKEGEQQQEQKEEDD